MKLIQNQQPKRKTLEKLPSIVREMDIKIKKMENN